MIVRKSIYYWISVAGALLVVVTVSVFYMSNFEIREPRRRILFDIPATVMPGSKQSNIPRFRQEQVENTPEIEDVTIVTAYMDIGTFQKNAVRRSPNEYRQWLSIFSRVSNPVIGYFDTERFADYFTDIRSRSPTNRTKIVTVSRNELWAFGLEDRIKDIFSRPGYPKQIPDTTDHSFVASTLSKYDFMHRVSTDNPFGTSYIAWLDVGYFRDMTRHGDPFNLPTARVPDFVFRIPPGFDSRRILYTEIYPRERTIDADRIVSTDAVWLAGGLFIGTTEVMMKWTSEFMAGVEQMMSTGWVGSDQQAIYWILNKLNTSTQIAVYRPRKIFHPWFELGLVCIKENKQSRRYNPSN